MGQIRLQCHDQRLLTPRVLSSVHMIGFDGTIWPCKAQLVERIDEAETIDVEQLDEVADFVEVVIHRNVDQSGRLFLLFPFDDLGELVVGTGTLVERVAPYCLDIELARGTLNRLRNLVSTWSEGGLEIGREYIDQIIAAEKRLAKSIFIEHQVSDAIDCLVLATETIQVLAVEFGRQVAAYRAMQPNRRQIFFGIQGDSEKVSDHYFPQNNMVIADAGFSRLEQLDASSTFKEEHFVDNEKLITNEDKYRVVGPIISVHSSGIPEWIRSMEHVEQRRQAILDVVEKSALQITSANCDLVHAVCGINGVGHRYLSFSQQMHITIDVLQHLENSQADLPVLVSFDQPWGERIAWSVGGGHSLQIADTLLRQGCRIDALGLEINLDYWPNGSLMRDATQWIELLDFWSHFGLPLFIFLRVPYSSDAARSNSEQRLPRGEGALGDRSWMQLATYLNSILPLLFARPNIQGVTWSFSDEGGAFSNCQPEWLCHNGDFVDDPIAAVFSQVVKTWLI